MQFRWIFLLEFALGAVASPAVVPRYDSATACAIVSSSASAFLKASPKATPTIEAQLGYDCLNSVPLHANEAKTLVEAMLPFIEWQSTITYLKSPPSGYTEPAVDLKAGFAAVIANITSGAYKTEYEFQTSLWKVVNSAHDGHFRFLPDLLSKAIGFRRPFPLVSVSLDGIASPKVYSYNDVLLSQTSKFVPSALATIDGESATTYLENFSQLGALNDPDALYNSMFFSPGFAAESAGWQGYFAGSGRFGWIYPGANTKITFENGTNLIVANQAAVIGNFTGVVDGSSFYQQFCTGPTPARTVVATTTAAIVTATGYPLPVAISADQQVSGYYLPDSDVAVLSMISFEPSTPIQFQQVVQNFLAAAKAAGKTKLIVDLAANGGGLILQGYDTFRQLFPSIVQDGNTRFRDTPEFQALAQAISGAFPSDFNPHNSNNSFLISLWETVFNYRYDYNISNQPFPSFNDKFAPIQYDGDSFTNLIRWDLNDDLLTINKMYGMGEYITGYGPRSNSTFTQPFPASDIIMLYDGYCASTCTLFSEFMRTQAGVKSIAYGGRPSTTSSTPLIQGIGGVKGANNYGYNYVNEVAVAALLGNPTAKQKALISPLANLLPVNRSTDTSLNVRDHILPDNIADGVPAQFIYEPADCRLFYTPAMMANVTAIWKAAALVAWGGGKCNAGSLPGSQSLTTTLASRKRESAEAKRDPVIIGLGDPAPLERSEAWVAKFTSGPYQSLADVFNGELANLTRATPWGNPYLGNQDYYHCCLVAVNESLEIQDGNLTFRSGQTILTGSIEDFETNPFPCDRTNDGTNGYPPQVWITYTWCDQNCPGWSMTWTDSYSLRLWLNPLVSFITPAAIFSLNIPRRRRLEVPRRLFPRNLRSPLEICSLAYKVPLAALIVTFDLVIWTIIVLTLAGPMLVSAAYEALLDFRLLKYLKKRMWRNSLSVRQRAHLLLIAIFGSLDLNPAWGQSKIILAGLPYDNLRRRYSSITSTNGAPSTQSPIGSFPDSKPSISSIGASKRKQVLAEYGSSVKAHIDTMKGKLRAALESQMSFGSSAGAAIVFYVGNFAYTLIQLQSNYGQVDLSHQLAFGMMWMIVPHVAIFGSLLLACNNPNFWESMIHSASATAQPLADVAEAGSASSALVDVTYRPNYKHHTLGCFWSKIYTPIYKTEYKTAWIWNRGQCKVNWIAKFSGEYPNLALSIQREVIHHNFNSLMFSTGIPAFFLVLVPAFLGAIVSYTTPAIGLGCRSLTLLAYTSSQLVLVLLWLADWMFWPVKYQETEDIPTKKDRIISALANMAWYSFFIIATFCAFFSGIMGTVFILLSLYSNCICETPAKYWASKLNSPDAVFYLGTFTNEQIWYAKHYWIPTGIAATCFLIVMTYVGWWYSSRTRHQFLDYVNNIDLLNEEDLAENDS